MYQGPPVREARLVTRDHEIEIKPRRDGTA